MISHKHKFIFTHIPKTGGTSITRALNPNAGIKNKPLKEMPLKDKEDYFKFTFVRNPWDRAVSMFFFRQKRGWLTKKKFELIGSAHNVNEVIIKEKQGCTTIFLCPVFKTKKNKNFLGITKFNLIRLYAKKKLLLLVVLIKKI